MSQSLDQALELLEKRARNDPELAGALRTVLEGALARLPEPVAEPVHDVSPEPEPVWEEPEPPDEPIVTKRLCTESA